MPFEPYADRVWRYQSEPAPASELELAKQVPPNKFAVFAHKLQMIAVEGMDVVTRTGATPTCSGTDFNTGIYNAQGDVLMGASGVWVHAVGPQLVIKYVLAAFKDDPGIQDGDCWHVSDALRFGLTHINDQETFMPVFYEGKLIAWVSAQIHEADVGGSEIGMPQTVKSKFEDGMLVAPIKIADNHKLRVDLVEMLAYMTRDPRAILLDIRTRWAACNRQRERILEVVEKEGLDFFLGATRKMIEETQGYTRKKVSSWLDGKFRDVQFLDTTGPELSLRRAAVTVTKTGEEMSFDVSGTSPEAPGPFNTPGNLIPGLLGPNFFSYQFNDLLPNVGVLDQIRFILPKGTFLSPRWDTMEPVAVAGIPAGFMAQAAYWRPIAKIVFSSPERSTISGGLSPGIFVSMFFGMDPWGTPGSGLHMEINAGGGGAKVEADGIDCLQPIWATLTDCEEAEYHERNFPFVYFIRNLPENHCGFGKQRGGSGLEYAYAVGDTPYWIDAPLLCGVNFPSACGIFGGYSAFGGRVLRIKNTQFFEKVKTREITLPIKVNDLIKQRSIPGEYQFLTHASGMVPMLRGDIVHGYCSGGGGYGDAIERSPEAVMKDFYDGIISEWVVRKIYGVAYDPETLEADQEATEALRRSIREERKRRGKPYEEFEKEWLAQKPPDEWLKAFGPWPGAPADGRVENGYVPYPGEYYAQ
jgi:N-methylhydantoinase B/oxoprolinase/acetone carboxylase alpha subunit